MVKIILGAFFISLIVSVLIILLFQKSFNIGEDYFEGPQKFHDRPTPRIGGAGIYMAFSIVIFYLLISKNSNIYLKFFISSLPIFFFGLLEDITRKVSPKVRLFAAVLSGLLAYFLIDAYLPRIGIPYIDSIFQIKLIAIVFTIIGIAGVVNAINIIDGYNGLVSVVSVIIFLALAYVGYKVHDKFVYTICFLMIGAIAGFFFWNYPFGKIFLGDGGAYFIGFTIAVLSVMLVKNHPQVSPWFPLLVVIYPVFETIFSFYRKKILRNQSPFKPDGFHFHMLIYKRVVPFVFDIHRSEKLMRNSATSPFLWLICSLGAIPAVFFWQNTPVLIIFTILFCIFYIWLYRSIVRFRFGKIIKMLKR
ncbi:undecaprenyl-phosphate alpha-N-acetylglucosaminyltransferase [Deferribacter desulfuricans SSM1]|uniref:Undecaprenyl-phosphate alpha-N-acetylglucosaminyltransferase n=1 Tax=Deferribacter desulfuricans (strain DSM 14783 / JCM 11476 / NBRC 101012 / SSM1) TaxID=639282 RepID=D3PBA5_DEFDS|nr:glycosyltransferase [Deferribacter desulfuricans]BAI79878.1 undecaprenyl-phosphate alpha-N-acetylglucosaminyltransferase [Deferribacter desulfuricans SSM1]